VTAALVLMLPVERRVSHRSRRVPARPPRERVRCGRGRDPEKSRPRPKPAWAPLQPAPEPNNPCRCWASGRVRLRPCPRTEVYVNGNPLNLTDPTGHGVSCSGVCTNQQQQVIGGLQVKQVQTEYQSEQAEQAGAQQAKAATALNGLATTVYGDVSSPGVPSSVGLVETLGATYGNYQGCLSANGYGQGNSLSYATNECETTSESYVAIARYLDNGGSPAALGNVQAEGVLLKKIYPDNLTDGEIAALLFGVLTAGIGVGAEAADAGGADASAAGALASGAASSGVSSLLDVAADTGVGGIGPVLQGTAGVDQTAAEIEAAGGRVLGREITLDVDGVRTRPDLFVKLPSGQDVFIEVKTGESAALTANQAAAFPGIQAGGAVPAGANAFNAGLDPGVALGPTPVWIVRQPWPLLGAP
jgi:hypothetical protein